jgi:hypothetical protein
MLRRGTFVGANTLPAVRLIAFLHMNSVADCGPLLHRPIRACSKALFYGAFLKPF